MTSIKYMTSLLTFYLKGEIRTEKNFIQFKTPNTILGLIPLGAKTEKFTIDQISSTTTNFRLRLKYLIFGIFWLLIAVSCLSDSDTLAAGLICLLLGINNIIDQGFFQRAIPQSVLHCPPFVPALLFAVGVL